MKTMIEESEPATTSQQSAASKAPTSAMKTSDREELLQIKTILVPLDFSRASMQALKYTIPLAEEFKAAIHLVHVQPADELTTISRAGHLMLNCADAIALMQDRLAEVQHKHDVRFWPDNCHVVSGRPFKEICKLARDIEADLIVLPTRGHSGLKHVVLGSTAERVVRYAPCPVLVPRGASYRSAMLHDTADVVALKLRKILVPVDFSECSLAGIEYAARLAKRTGASLRLFHVVFPYDQVFGIDRVGADVTPLIEAAKTAIREDMSKLVRMTFLRGVPCETEIRTGSTIDEICGETERPDIDLVVTSTHGRGGFKRALLGSVAEHVVRYAECPVIIVPSRGRS
jgi:nucleotide-binding universal stress UspA family protein